MTYGRDEPLDPVTCAASSKQGFQHRETGEHTAARSSKNFGRFARAFDQAPREAPKCSLLGATVCSPCFSVLKNLACLLTKRQKATDA
jgi:hypothetical protein